MGRGPSHPRARCLQPGVLAIIMRIPMTSVFEGQGIERSQERVPGLPRSDPDHCRLEEVGSQRGGRSGNHDSSRAANANPFNTGSVLSIFHEIAFFVPIVQMGQMGHGSRERRRGEGAEGWGKKAEEGKMTGIRPCKSHFSQRMSERMTVSSTWLSGCFPSL